MTRLVLQVKKLSEHAILPARASAGAAGYDLCRCAAVRARGSCATQGGIPAEGLALTFAPSPACLARPRSAYDGVVPARGKALLKTDIAIAVPAGTYGRVGAWWFY